MVKFIPVIILLIIFIACDTDIIPPGPPRDEPLTVKLYTAGNQINYIQWNQYKERYYFSIAADRERFNEITVWQIPYRLDLTNQIDEVVDGTKHIDIELYLQDQFNNWNDTLRFENNDPDKLVLYHPGHTYALNTDNNLIWDQTKWTGESIHKLNNYTRYFFQPRVDSAINDDGVMQDRWVCDTINTVLFDTVPEYKIPIEIWAYARVKTLAEYDPIYTDTTKVLVSYLFPRGFFDLAKGSCGEAWIFPDSSNVDP